MSASAQDPIELEPLYAWLCADPDSNPEAELKAALEYCHRLVELSVPPERRLSLLNLFHGRVLDLAGRYRGRLIQEGLPLSRNFHLPVRRLVQLCVELAGAYLSLARALAKDMSRTQRLGDNSLGAHALDLLTEAWVAGAIGGMPAHYDLWGTAHALFMVLGAPGPDPGLLVAGRNDRTFRAYKRLLALSVVQPESLSAREIAWVAEFLGEQAGLAELSPLDGAWSSGYWIDPAQDVPPVAVTRRSPPPVDGLLHLATDPLARLLTQRLERLEGADGEPSEDAAQALVTMTAQADLPEGLTPRELVPLMRRLREHWGMPPLRELPRRHKHYSVEVCLGLRAIWEMRQNGEPVARIGEWVVVNESPGGFAIMSVEQVPGPLSAGMAVAIRQDGVPKWSLCIVRWIRTENPSQVELGLQVVSDGATPVRLGFRSGQVREMVHGLLLPPMGEIRRHRAIMAPAGTNSSRRFVFIHEGQRLYVAQGRLLSLDLQTTSVEVFQFEVDPYPT